MKPIAGCPQTRLVTLDLGRTSDLDFGHGPKGTCKQFLAEIAMDMSINVSPPNSTERDVIRMRGWVFPYLRSLPFAFVRVGRVSQLIRERSQDWRLYVCWIC